MSYQMKKSLAAIVAIFFIVAAFSNTQIASADGNEIEFEKIVVSIDKQEVDMDGDGQNEAVDAYFVVNDRGTMTFDPYRNFKFRVQWDNASIQPAEGGQILVQARGYDDQTGQNYFISFQFDPDQAASGNSSPIGGGEIILIDLVGSSAVQLRATVQIYL